MQQIVISFHLISIFLNFIVSIFLSINRIKIFLLTNISVSININHTVQHFLDVAAVLCCRHWRVLLCSYKHAVDGLYRVVRDEGPVKLMNGATMAASRATLVTIGQVMMMFIWGVVSWLNSDTTAVKLPTVLSQLCLKTPLKCWQSCY